MLYRVKENQSISYFGKEAQYLFFAGNDVYIFFMNGSPKKFRGFLCKPFIDRLIISVKDSSKFDKAELAALLTNENDVWREFAKEHLQVFEEKK